MGRGIAVLDVVTDPVGTTIQPLNKSGYTLSVWPNPASDKINIATLDNLNGEVVLTIVSALGIVVDMVRFDSEKMRSGYELSVQNLQPGVYTLRISDFMSSESIRFVKN